MDNLFHFFKSINDMYSKQTELAAIWLRTPLVTGEGRTSRLAPDATVCVSDGQLIDCSEENKPTHKVIGCIGTLVNQFEITVIDLETKEPSQIKL
jgi:hypothetical protein